MVVADLHAHTTNSDGTLELDEVPAAARRAGVDVVAITDHDRLNPALDGPTTERDGVTLLHGIELRVESDAGRVDLLGYGVERTDGLVAECERLQRDREARGRAIVERVEDRLGVDLPVEIRPGIGRPHVARAIAEATELTVEDAFADLIGDDGPCYVPRDVPSFERGRRLLAEACPVVGLAHPLRYPDPAAALALSADLDAVELHYPYGREVDRTPVERAIERHDLLATGGSDAHGRELGVDGLDADAWERVRAAL